MVVLGWDISSSAALKVERWTTTSTLSLYPQAILERGCKTDVREHKPCKERGLIVSAF